MRSVVQAGVVLSFGGRPAESLRLLVAQCLFLLLCFGAAVSNGQRIEVRYPNPAVKRDAAKARRPLPLR